MEPRFNEVAGDRPNLFVKWRVRYIEVLFHTFYCNFGRDIEIISFVISRSSLNRGSLNRGSTVLEEVHREDLSDRHGSFAFSAAEIYLGMPFSCDLLSKRVRYFVVPRARDQLLH